MKFASVFSDNMVLQRNTPIKIWGWAEAGTTVTVKLENSQDARLATCDAQQIIADKDGKWIATLDAPESGSDLMLTASSADETVSLNNIVMGDVWICSGQSNMEMPMGGWENQPIDGGLEAIETADYPEIRLFTVTRRIATQPEADCEGEWSVCSLETVSEFSATAYFFGRKLYQETGVPQGLIHTSWGGTRVEAWTQFDAQPDELSDEVAAIQAMTNPPADFEPNDTLHANCVSVLFNGMINPLIPLRVKGTIWYQGESNAHEPGLYRERFPAMVENWRDLFGQGESPFYFVQIAPFQYEEGRDSQGLREVQRECLQLIPNSGMACLMDKGTPSCIHPPFKREAGERMALWSLVNDYEKDVVVSGPLYREAICNDSVIKVCFDHCDDGLVAQGDLDCFELCDADGNWQKAEARVDGDCVIVSSPSVETPTAVRYGWQNWLVGNFFNGAGLPASSFSSK